jgi:hypothetical protein
MKLVKFATAMLIVLGSASSSLHTMRHLGGEQGNGEGANVFIRTYALTETHKRVLAQRR